MLGSRVPIVLVILVPLLKWLSTVLLGMDMSVRSFSMTPMSRSQGHPPFSEFEAGFQPGSHLLSRDLYNATFGY